MSLPALLLELTRVLPASPAALLARSAVILYLLFRPACRREIRDNYRVVLGRDRPLFWFRNAWCLGGNLSLMARIGSRQVEKLIDRRVVWGQNWAVSAVEQDLHVTMATFHLGAWELIPAVLTRLDNRRVHLVIGNQSDPLLARRLERVRRRSGAVVLAGLRQALRSSGQGSVTGFLLDNTTRGARVQAMADGLSMSMPGIAFRFAAVRSETVQPIFCSLVRGRIELRYHPPGGPDAVFEALLREIRYCPEQWLFWGKSGALACAN